MRRAKSALMEVQSPIEAAAVAKGTEKADGPERQAGIEDDLGCLLPEAPPQHRPEHAGMVDPGPRDRGIAALSGEERPNSVGCGGAEQLSDPVHIGGSMSRLFVYSQRVPSWPVWGSRNWRPREQGRRCQQRLRWPWRAGTHPRTCAACRHGQHRERNRDIRVQAAAALPQGSSGQDGG